MEGSQSNASRILWIDEEEYYFVCPECFRNWSVGYAWQKSKDDDWEAIESTLVEKLRNERLGCELCEYDQFELSRRVQRGSMEYDDVPGVAKGDVFANLVLRREPEIEIEDSADLAEIEEFEERKARAKFELVDEFGIEEPPKSIAQRQQERLREHYDQRIEEMDRTWEEFFEVLEDDLDRLVATHYGVLLAEYDIAMSNNLWRLSQSGLFAEFFGKFPGVGFVQPFLEDLLREVRIARDSDRYSDALLEEIDGLERQLGGNLREHYEQLLDLTDKDIGRHYLLTMITHHERLKMVFE